MKRSFFSRHALLILMIVFFFVPFGMRGARMAINNMRNEVKDWLPDSFSETKDLAVFQKYFWGEGFVVVSWNGCRGTVDDERFRLFVDKFFPDAAPSENAELRELLTNKAQYVDEELGLYARQLAADSPFSVRDFVGNRLGLYSTGDYHTNWAGQDEKWLRGDGGQWYYIKPSGDIFEWSGRDTLLARLARSTKNALLGPPTLDGTLVATLGEQDGPWYYNNPRHLEADLIKSVITGPSLLSDLTREDGVLEGDTAAAMERLKGWLFGPDGEQACLLVTLSDRGRENLHRVVGRGFLGKPRGKLLQLAAESGLDTPPRISAVPFPLDLLVAQPAPSGGPMVHLGGPPVDNVAIDEEGQATLVRLVGLSGCVGIFISWLSFRNIPVIMMLSFVGVACAFASLSFVWWSGSVMDAVLMSMPSLVYVLALSGAVHIVNYYRDTVEQHGYPGSPAEALKHGWKPCTLAAITTALGLVSLSISDILPISKFGVFSAVGVVFTLAMLFTFLPAALTLWPPKNFVHKDNSRSEAGLAEWVRRFWNRVGVFAVRRHGLVTASCLAILVIAALGLPKMKTSVRLLGLFNDDNKINQDYIWLEKNLGKLVPMELLVWVKPEIMRASELVDAEDEDAELAGEERFRLNFLERMEITENITRAIDGQFGPQHGDITGTAMRATSFVPPLPGSSGGSFSMRGAFSSTLTDYRDEISTSDYFRVVEDTNQEIWRISLRLGALNNVDYALFVAQLKKAVEPVLAAYTYRDEILRAVDRARAGKRIRGGRVLLLGAPLGKSRFASQRLVADEPRDETQLAKREEMDDGPQQVDQPAIFATTLRSLLRNASLNYRHWHDPSFALPDDWAEKLADYDCVVVMSDDPRYDRKTLLANAKSVIDAQDHVYQGSGYQTALDRDEPVGVMYTGLVPIVYKAQRTLLQSLIESTGWAFVAITIVMILVLRSVTAGTVSMLPNIFPVVIVFGYMGWRQTLVDIGTMMTASVAMGVAVDDTVHFLTWFRRGLDQGMERKRAIKLAYDRCATAMTQTTLIGGLGLSVFALSSFTPTHRFGILMLVLMVAALVGDLIFLPAILAGPAGRVFSRRRPKCETPPQETAVQEMPSMDKVVGHNQVNAGPLKRPRRVEGPHLRRHRDSMQ